MQPLLERCVGLDVHHAIIAATALIGAATLTPRKVTRQFPAHRQGLLELRDWVLSLQCTHVLMEATGVYWMPVYAALEGALQVVVANAQHLKKVPGRKTDVKDSEWLAYLLRMGLVTPSFVPPKPLRDLRCLTRDRSRLVHTRSSLRSRLLALLAKAGITLSTVATDVFGVSGMLMLRALAEGTTSPADMANMARGLLRRKIPQLTLALEGFLDGPLRAVLAAHLDLLGRIDERIERVEAAIALSLHPYQAYIDLLCTIPGVDLIVAAAILAEIGTDMSPWRNAGALARWTGVAPGNNRSAGKSGKTPTTPGNPYLKTILVEAAHAASKCSHGYLRAKYQSHKAQTTAGEAAMVVAHKILIAAYHILSKRQPYKDLGDNYLDKLHEARVTRQLVHRLERLGYTVDLHKPTATAA